MSSDISEEPLKGIAYDAGLQALIREISLTENKRDFLRKETQLKCSKF